MIARDKNLNQLLTNFLIAFWLAIGVGVIDVHLARAEKEKQAPAPHPSLSSEGQALESGTQNGELVKEENKKMISNMSPTGNPPQNAFSEATSTEKTQAEEIEDYVRQKFGKDADKAFLLLKGKGEGTCAENRNLDPKAVNVNKDGSRDFGLFQINSRFHPVFKLNLHKDWRANVDYAYRMFENDRRSFKRWTCGKIYRI